MALQIRRGLENERTAGGGVVFAEGELVYVTDTDALYVGDGSTAGGVKLTDNAGAVLGSYITADTVSSTLDLQQNLDLNGKDIIGTGNINIAGTINATGNVNIGDDVNTDTVDFAAKITSSLTPNADATYDLGTTLLKWNNIHAVRLDGDVEGSVFADDSGILVDGVAGKIVGAVDTASLRTSESKIALGEGAGETNQGSFAIALGYNAGETDQESWATAVGFLAGTNTQGDRATAIGSNSGQVGQGAGAVAIGVYAGNNGQGADAVAIGKNAGHTNQDANSIVINATGVTAQSPQASSLVIKPVRDAVGTTAVMYNASNGEVTHTATPAFNLQGNLTGDVTGNVTGQIKGSGGSAVLAPNTGPADAELSVLNVTATGTITGAVTGNVTGNTAGYHTGDVKGSVFGDDSTVLVDAVSNTLSGNLTGNVTGDTAGTHTGAVVGSVTGNTAGYHTGDVTGTIFGDDSTVLVDAVNNKIIGTVESASITGTVVTADLLKLQENRIIALPGLDPATTYAAEGGIPFIDFNISTAVDEVFLSVGETAGLSLSAITDPTQRSAITIAANVNGSGASHTLSSSAYRSPTAGFASGSTVQNNDTLYLQTMAGFDGSNDIVSSRIKSTASSVSVGAITSTLEIKVTDDAGVSYNGLEISPSAVASTLPIQFPVVANDTARGTLVPTPAAGMMLFMTAGTSPSATTQLQVYNGTAWVNV